MKIAILGGGMGALSAAWKLSDPDLDEPHEITIYQRDGLLGGKGASTRSSAPAEGERIQEHGIHIIMGFYDNALGLLRDVYAELDASGYNDILPWQDALTPWDHITLSREIGAVPDYQQIAFPENDLSPGNAEGSSTIATMVSNAFGWMLLLLGKLGISLGLPFVAKLKHVVHLGMKALLFLMGLGLPVSGLLGGVRWWIDFTLEKVWTVVEPAIDTMPKVAWLWMGLWLVGTNLRGMIEDGLISPDPDWSTIDDQDYSDWLKAHDPVGGTLPAELAWDSPAIRAIYDLAFSNGQKLSAGTVLFNLARITLDYKGHLAYKMNAGMGEVVFAPLYRALDARPNVEFKFFHEVDQITHVADPITGEMRIAKIVLSQRTSQNGPFDPLQSSTVELPNGSGHTIDTWRDTPPLLGNETPLPLVRGMHFDAVVLGISVAALPSICSDLATADPAFGAMFGIRTVKTQAVQLWFDATLEELGWLDGSVALSTFSRPFNTWVDMTHTGRSEGWSTPVGSVAYFVNEFTGPDDVPNPDDFVWDDLKNAALTQFPRLWPNFDLSMLRAPAGKVGIERLQCQYWRGNTDLSDRYVIAKAGTNKLRLAADGTQFLNLALAGDWVETELNTGCLEAATLGGFSAAQAIIDGRVTS